MGEASRSALMLQARPLTTTVVMPALACKVRPILSNLVVKRAFSSQDPVAIKLKSALEEYRREK